MALMTKKISIYGPEYAVLLTLLSGVIILAAGLLKLGFLIDFISLPVTAGFCSAAAVTIASSQVDFYIKLDFPPVYCLFLCLFHSNVFFHNKQTNTKLHTAVILPNLVIFILVATLLWQLRSLLGVAVDPEHKSHTHAGVVDYYIGETAR